MSSTTASALPDPIQPTIYYMEAVLPVQLRSTTKVLHFSAPAMDSGVKNILPPPFSKSSIMSCSSACSNTESSPASSSLSSCSTLDDGAADDEPSSKSSSIPLLLNPAKKGCKLSTGKQYNCRFCFKRFMRPSSLKIHIYSHTGEKPFNCTHPGCRRKFSVQSNMRRHLRMHSS